MNRLSTFFHNSGFRLALCLLAAAALPLVSVPASQKAGGPPTAQAIVTDRPTLPLSSQFAPPNVLRVTGGGDVLFSSGGSTALFRWNAATGARTRLLQVNDFFAKFDIPGETDEDIPEGILLESIGGGWQTNSAGHAAMLLGAAFLGAYDPAGVFLLDERGYHLVVGRRENAPEGGWRYITGFGALRLNDNDQVAFLAYLSDGTQGIVRWSPDGTLEKIAYVNDPAPGIDGGTIQSLTLTGLNDAGQVSFAAQVARPAPLPGALTHYIWSVSGMTLVVMSGGDVPGGGRFQVSNTAFLNSQGKLAFPATVMLSPSPNKQGIFTGSSVATVTKLVADGDATPLGGTFSSPYVLRGFNNAGKALFQANVAAGSSPWALFLKDQASDPQVVFSALQAVPGGNIVSLLQASLNNQDKALFLAGLQGGSAPIGWYLGGGATGPVKIALQGESTPLGGTFGIQGRQAPWHLSDAGRVAFAADILGLNAVAAFLWESGVAIRAIVCSNDPLPPGANQVIRTQSGAPVLTSRNEVVFRAFNAGGRATVFAKPIESGMDGLRRLWGEFDPAPEGGVILGSSNLGAINDSGAYVFSAPVLGGATYPGSGIFGMRPGEALEAIALSGDSAPGGGFFSGFGVPQLNNTPKVAFWGAVTGGPPQGIFIASPGLNHQKVAQVGDARPGGGTFGAFSSPVTLNVAGQVGFFGSRFEAPQIGGLFVGGAATAPLKVVAQNDVIAGAGTVTGISTPWDMNASGQLAFLLQLSGSPYGNTSGVFSGSGGGTPLALALAGAPAPGTDGGTFGNLRADNIDINDAGQVAFWAGVNGSPTGVWNGVYLSTAGSSPMPWFMKNRSLPDGSSAIQMGGASRSIALSESGELAVYVVAEKNDPERDDELPRIVIVGSDGALRLFAVTSDKAEGTGSYFGRIYPQLSANAAGRFFFSSIMVNGPAKAGFFWNGLEKK